VYDLDDNHIKWALCHHGRARPQVADGEDGLHICRNISSRGSRQRVVLQLVGLATPHSKNVRNVTQGLGLEGICWNYPR
jgi:hypothetical protein